MTGPIEYLKDRIFNKNKKSSVSLLTDVVEMISDLHCLPEIVGRDFEVRDARGKIVYTVRQKPMDLAQFNLLNKHLALLKQKQKEAIPKSKDLKKGRLR